MRNNDDVDDSDNLTEDKTISAKSLYDPNTPALQQIEKSATFNMIYEKNISKFQSLFDKFK